MEGRTLVSIAGGWRHSVAVDTAGLLYAWGWNKVRVQAPHPKASALPFSAT